MWISIKLKRLLIYSSVGWCFVCTATEKPSCVPLGHSIVKMTADEIFENLDAANKLKEELLKLNDQKTDNLAKAVQKRKQVQEKLSFIMKSITAAGDRVKQLEDENNLRLTEMVSILERNNSPNIAPSNVNKSGNEDLFLSESMELVDDSSPYDTAETLRLKMINSVELSKQNLCEAIALFSVYDIHEKLKITIQLYDDEDCPISTCSSLEGGFRLQPAYPPTITMFPEIRQEFILINHVITSFLHNQLSLESAPKEDSAVASMTSLVRNFQATSLVASNNKFTLSQSSVFILRLFQSNIQIGELHIRPVPTFPHREFVQTLGEFCYKSPQIFCDSVEKVF